MQEIKNIVCDNLIGENLWKGVLVPTPNGNYEGYVHSSVNNIFINFEYIGCDVRMTLKKNDKNDSSKSDINIYNLILLNKLGITEWFVIPDKCTIVCTEVQVNNCLAKTYKKNVDNARKMFI